MVKILGVTSSWALVNKVSFVLNDFVENFNLAQVSNREPTQDVMPLTLYNNGIYVSGELCEYWHSAFPLSIARDVFESVKFDIDDERAGFTRALAWRGPPPQ